MTCAREPPECGGVVVRWGGRVGVVEDVARGGELAQVAAERTAQLIAAVRGLDTGALTAASRLPGWSRLTIVCHLRYGASSLLRMTEDVLAGRETAYYRPGEQRSGPRRCCRRRASGRMTCWNTGPRRRPVWTPCGHRSLLARGRSPSPNRTATPTWGRCHWDAWRSRVSPRLTCTASISPSGSRIGATRWSTSRCRPGSPVGDTPDEPSAGRRVGRGQLAAGG
jgi:hypothetical protein